MKNKVVLVAVITILALVSVYAVYNKNNNKDYVVRIYEKNKSNVNKGASTLFDDDTYKKLSEKDKQHDMERLLKMYEKVGDIKELYYDASNKTFTFQYKDGVLGGMKMTEFDPMLN